MCEKAEIFRIKCESDMMDLGFMLAERVLGLTHKRILVLLNGCMGAGKTTFSRGFFKALTIGESVISPTYAILHSYMTESPYLLFHMDMYRLHSQEEFEELEVEEILSSKQPFIFVVEWANKFEKVWQNLRDIYLVHLDFTLQANEGRLVKLRGL